MLNEQCNPVAKECYSCHRVQSLESFYRDKTGIVSRASACAECRRATSKQYREEHADYFRRYHLANRDYLVAYQKEWVVNNSGKQQIYSAKSQARRAEALANCLPDQPEYMTAISQLTYCEITGETESLEVDHIMPITKGRWGNTVGNLMKLGQSLNSSKGNKNIFDWLQNMEQERLDYLLDQHMTVEQFRQKFEQVLTIKASEKGLSFIEYKEQYNEEYRREQNGQYKRD